MVEDSHPPHSVTGLPRDRFSTSTLAYLYHGVENFLGRNLIFIIINS